MSKVYIIISHVCIGFAQEIAHFDGASHTIQTTDVEPKWPGGATGPPKDTPECGFNNELCQESKSSSKIDFNRLLFGLTLKQ